MVHISLFRKIKKTAKYLESVRCARNYLNAANERRGIFRNSAPLMEELLKNLEKTVPDEREIKEKSRLILPLGDSTEEDERKLAVVVLAKKGGMVEIAESARKTKDIIPELTCAIREDMSEIDFREISEESRKSRIIDTVSEIPLWASTILSLSGFFICFRDYMVSGFSSISGTWLSLTAVSTVAMLVISSIKKHHTVSSYFTPENIEANIMESLKGLSGLRKNLDGIIEVASLFYRRI